MNREKLAAMYLEWFNNYLTIDKFAEHHGLHVDEAIDLLDVARRCHENLHPEA